MIFSKNYPFFPNCVLWVLQFTLRYIWYSLNRRWDSLVGASVRACTAGRGWTFGLPVAMWRVFWLLAGRLSTRWIGYRCLMMGGVLEFLIQLFLMFIIIYRLWSDKNASLDAWSLTKYIVKNINVCDIK